MIGLDIFLDKKYYESLRYHREPIWETKPLGNQPYDSLNSLEQQLFESKWASDLSIQLFSLF